MVCAVVLRGVDGRLDHRQNNNLMETDMIPYFNNNGVHISTRLSLLGEPCLCGSPLGPSSSGLVCNDQRPNFRSIKKTYLQSGSKHTHFGNKQKISGQNLESKHPNCVLFFVDTEQYR